MTENYGATRHKLQVSRLAVIILPPQTKINQNREKMFKALFAQKSQTKLILLTAIVVMAVVVFAFAGTSEIVTHEDETQTIQRSIFGIKLN